jgi:hypothetical protein
VAVKQTNTADNRAMNVRQAAPPAMPRTSRPLYGYTAQPSRSAQPEPNGRAGEAGYSNRGFADRVRAAAQDAADARDANPRRYESRVVRPQRPGNDQDSDAQMQSLIGDDEFVGDWHH